jgi:L-malate glycosyltransferase
MPETGRRRRVLIVGPSLRYLGGQAVQAARLLAELRTIAALDVEYLVVDPALPTPFGVLQRIPFVRTIVTSIAYVLTLLWRVPRSDVVHIFSASYWSFLLAPGPALLISRLFGKRILLNYHSGQADDHLRHWGWHAKPLMRIADIIVVPTDYLVDVFRQHGIASIAIANHIDLAAMRDRFRGTIRPRFFSNRNLEALYNVGATVSAFATVQHLHPDASLVIAGDGSQREDLEAQVQRLQLRHVRFAGPVAPQDMAAHYDAADVYVNASLIDNMPLSILEAYASRLPVVTSDAGGIPWIASDGHTALVVPSNSSEALGAAMLHVLSHPDAARARADAARAFLESRFVWDKVRAAWQTAYLGS